MDIDYINLILASVILGIGSLLSIVVAVRTRLKLDFSMIVISLGYLLSFILRLPFSSSLKGLNFFTGVAFLIVWSSMYFFVFEMKILEDTLKADSY
jgi:hypothetical protein